MTASSGTYEAFALRYGSTSTSRASKYYRFEKYQDTDRAIGMDFLFWLVRNEERTVLVDCGFDDVRTAARGYLQETPPLELLSRLDVTAGEVDHVVISHMHFDHIGNLDLFPNATFSVARAEYEFWTGPFADRLMLNESIEPHEVETVMNLHRDGRLRLIEDEGESIFGGIDLLPMRGHTPGQMISTVSTGSGPVVLASDAVHLYEELTLDRPYWVFNDLEGMYRTYDLLRDMDADPATTIVAGHDPAVMTMFEPVNDHCVNLTARC